MREIYIVGMKQHSCFMTWMHFETHMCPDDWTDNMCEWDAYYRALKYIYDNGLSNVLIKMDSKLVYKQITREVKIKSKKLRQIFYNTIPLINTMKDRNIRYKLIESGENKARRYI